jgi:hypothetical protein
VPVARVPLYLHPALGAGVAGYVPLARPESQEWPEYLRDEGLHFARWFARDPQASLLPPETGMRDKTLKKKWNVKVLKSLAESLGLGFRGLKKGQLIMTLCRARSMAEPYQGRSDSDGGAAGETDVDDTSGVDDTELEDIEDPPDAAASAAAAAASAAAAAAAAPAGVATAAAARATLRPTAAMKESARLARLAAAAAAKADTVRRMHLQDSDSDGADPESQVDEIARRVAAQWEADQVVSSEAQSAALAKRARARKRKKIAAQREKVVAAAVAEKLAALRKTLPRAPTPARAPARGRDAGVGGIPPAAAVAPLLETASSASDSDSDESEDADPHEALTAADALRAATARHGPETNSSQVNSVAYMTTNMRRNTLIDECDVSQTDLRCLTAQRVTELRTMIQRLIRDMNRPAFLSFEPTSGDRLQIMMDFADIKITAPDMALVSYREALQSTIVQTSVFEKMKTSCDKFMSKVIKTASANAARLDAVGLRNNEARFDVHHPASHPPPRQPQDNRQWVYGVGATTYVYSRSGNPISCDGCNLLGHYRSACPRAAAGGGDGDRGGGGRGGRGRGGRGGQGQPPRPP